MTTPQDEAAAILTRLFEALARVNNKTLNARTRADIARACELLSHAGADLGDLFDELPRATPGEAVAASYAGEPDDPNYLKWKRTREKIEAER